MALEYNVRVKLSKVSLFNASPLNSIQFNFIIVLCRGFLFVLFLLGVGQCHRYNECEKGMAFNRFSQYT